MKLNFALLAILGTEKDVFVTGDCMISDLKGPDNFKKWDCVPPAIDYVRF